MEEEFYLKVYLFKPNRVPPIKIAKNSQLKITIETMDYTIPVGATASAFAKGELSDTVYTQSCTVVGNRVSFTPVHGFFVQGRNILQYEINNGVIPLAINVSCEISLPSTGESKEPEQVLPYVTRAENAANEAEAAADRAQEVKDSIPADYTALSDGVNQLNSDLTDIAISKNIGFLSEAHEGYYIANDKTTHPNQWLSYTDCIEIPTNADSITVSAKTVTTAGAEYSISPSVHVMDENGKVLRTYGTLEIADRRTFSLQISGAKYVQVVQPSKKAKSSKYIKFNMFDAFDAFGRTVTSQSVAIHSQNYSEYFSDANNAPVNNIFTIIADVTGDMVANLPTYGVNGVLLTIGGMSGGDNVKMQVFSTSKETYVRRCDYQGLWESWDTLSLYGGYITTSNYQSFFTDANNAPLNKIIGIQATITEKMIANLPEYNMASQANLITLCGRNPLDGNGNMNALQIYAVGSGGNIYIRSSNFARTIWSKWSTLSELTSVPVFHVGANREYTSFTQCIKDLANDTSEKIIYIDGGVYDIAQEYIDADVPVIPSDGDYNNNYAPYNVWVPKNTHVIGMGNVVLRYMPDAGSVTEAQSKSVSPLNIDKSCTIENVTVECKNGRYCCHIDGSTSNFNDAIINCKNVNFIKHVNDANRGWREVVGIGVGIRKYLRFDECTIETENDGGAVFYAHCKDKVGSEVVASEDSGNIVITNSIFTSAATLSDMIRLQSRTTNNPLNIKVKIIGSYIKGGIHLQSNTSDAPNCFNLTMLNSGSPTVTIDDVNNPYPVSRF